MAATTENNYTGYLVWYREADIMQLPGCSVGLDESEMLYRMEANTTIMTVIGHCVSCVMYMLARASFISASISCASEPLTLGYLNRYEPQQTAIEVVDICLSSLTIPLDTKIRRLWSTSLDPRRSSINKRLAENQSQVRKLSNFTRKVAVSILSRTVPEYLKSQGTLNRTTISGTFQHNGVIKQVNNVRVQNLCCILNVIAHPKMYQVLAVSTIIYLKQCIPINSRVGSTLFNVWCGSGW